MAYYPSRETVRRNRGLLLAIQRHVELGEPLILEPADGQSLGGARYWVRNLLKSAEVYPDFGFPDLADQVTVSITPDSKVLLKPKSVPSDRAPSVERFDEIMAMSELMAESAKEKALSFWPSAEFDEEGFIEGALDNGWEAHLSKLDDERIMAYCVRVSEHRPSSPFDLIGEEQDDN